MKRFFVFLFIACFFGSNCVLSEDLNSEILSDLSQHKNRPYSLLERYTKDLSSTEQGPKKQIALKVAAILGRGAGVGDFKQTRSATKAEKDVMVKALHSAYQTYPLAICDFFTSPEGTPAIMRHKAILFALTQTMAIKAFQDKEDEKVGRKEILESRGTFSAFMGYYQFFKEIGEEGDVLQEKAKGLIQSAGLKGYDAAFNATEMLFRFADLEDPFFKGFFTRTPEKLLFNTEPHPVYRGALDNVVNVHTYNHGLDFGVLSSRTKGKVPSSSLFDSIRERLKGRNTELSIVIATAIPEDNGFYELRPHGWIHPDAEFEVPYSKSENVWAGIFGNPEITIKGQEPNTIGGSHNVHTHPGGEYNLLSPANMNLSKPRGPLNPTDSYAFISAVLKEKGVDTILTLHLLLGDTVLDEVRELGWSGLDRTVNVGDFFYWLHFSPHFSRSNPMFLKLLNDLYS